MTDAELRTILDGAVEYSDLPDGIHEITLQEGHRHTTWTLRITTRNGALIAVDPIETNEWAFDPNGAYIVINITTIQRADEDSE